MLHGILAGLIFIFTLTTGWCLSVGEIANSLHVTFNLEANYSPKDEQFKATLTLRNTGSQDIPKGSWAIYFCSVRVMEPDVLIPDPEINPKPNPSGAKIGNSGFTVYHVNGCLFKLQPNDAYVPIKAGQTRDLSYTGQFWHVTRTDTMPNFYVASTVVGDNGASVITNTEDESISFMKPLLLPEQYKRISSDKYGPYTMQQRYDQYAAADLAGDVVRVVPRPVSMNLSPNLSVLITSSWKVVAHSTLDFEANYLAGKLGLTITSTSQTTNAIDLVVSSGFLSPSSCSANEERYSVTITQSKISITGKNPAALFYGIQTLLGALSPDNRIGTGQVDDCPRFPYRGFMLDVGRHFVPAKEVMRLLDVMAMYKLNKFHFHLSDDEGFRVEIPALPELTTIGATQCHDVTGQECILPQLGSPPTKQSSGSGFYTETEYKNILKYADDRHIQVIPEIDMPGHAHAMINAIKYRVNTLNETQYDLVDPDDRTNYFSVQMFTDNAINPCINSTYRFVEKLIDAFIALHAGVQDLKVFHWGGDEVPGAWLESPACDRLKQTEPSLPLNATVRQLKGYFARRLADLLVAKGLDTGTWEDGVITEEGMPMNITTLKTEVYVNAWDNVWEWGTGRRAYDFANSGYKTVISHATHLYFDHPVEPDPEERGYYWATRVTDSFKAFSFFPDDIYKNLDVDRFGNKLESSNICKDFGCPDLKKPENIIGISGHIWCETVRTTGQLHNMLFPRILALAERAWHKADWENETNEETRRTMINTDWKEFATRLGHRELSRLDDLGINYHIRPPAVIISGNQMNIKTELPGLAVDMSTDWGLSWTQVYQGMTAPDSDAVFTAKSADGSRRSRQVRYTKDVPPSAATGLHTNIIISLIYLIVSINI